MIVYLDKADLISLVNGKSPDFTVMDYPLISARGHYTDAYGWRWHSLEELTEEQLLEVYNMCKNSWK